MSVFDSLIGQAAVCRQLERAACERGTAAMSHAWLFTGPPGSGRSLAARALAAALQCETTDSPGCGQCHQCRTVMSGNHPDLTLMNAEGVTITVEETRALVGESYESPSSGRYRIIIVEDADRMSERTTNVLLKAIEEPPAFTVWMLCTPSLDDVLPTIRSRCRHVGLVVPPAEDVAQLLVSQGVDPQQALVAARAAQSHIGRARGLVRDAGVWEDRQQVVREAVSVRGVGDAVYAAANIMEILDNATKREADSPSSLRGASDASDAATSSPTKQSRGKKNADDPELAEFKRQLGIAEGQNVPSALRKQVRDFEEKLKKRQKRQSRDSLDRVMIDLLSVYRDVLIVQLGGEVDLMNIDFESDIRRIAAESTPEQSVRRIEAIGQARERLAGNGAPLLTLEAMMVALRPQG
ncbi:MAG: DNA polymerase III subunit delta' [Actinomycetaceae bacterium]|nr:DNA polymerase III subunit delta' [Actinomycetaceae bacterium]